MRLFGSFYQYSAYFQRLFADFPSSSPKSLSALKARIADDYSVVFQGLFRELTALPNIEEADWTITGAPDLQTCWAAENGFHPVSSNPTAEIFLEQLRRFRPDVWVAFGYPLGCDFLQQARKECPSLRVIACWDGRHLHDPERFRGADIIFTCLDKTVAFYQSHGISAAYLPYFFDTQALSRLTPTQQVPRVAFPASIQLSVDGHNERLAFIHQMASIPEFEPRLDLIGLDYWRIWAGLVRRRAFGQIKEILTAFRIKRPPVYGVSMFQHLAESLITANIHIDAAGSFAGNIRLFEATGVGSCLLTDHKRNISSFFEPDAEIVTFSSPEEAREKARWLLDHVVQTREIARRGQRRTQMDHSASVRAFQLFDALNAKQ